MRSLATLLLVSACFAFAQDAQPAVAAKPTFEVADIRLNNSGDVPGTGTILPGGQFRAINIPVKEILKFAYSLRNEVVVGAPAWIETDHYDIIGRSSLLRWQRRTFQRCNHPSTDWSSQPTFLNLRQGVLAG
jgi:hypothetical protein